MEKTDARLLIVDDEEPARRLLRRILEQTGYSCLLAADVAEARERIAGEEISLVITDLDMPGPSGFELVRELAAERPDVATIMVTGKGDRALAQGVLETGAYGYITKPLEPDEIVINVFNALRRRNLELENRLHREQLEEMVKARTSGLWDTLIRLEHVLDDLRSSHEETIRKLAIAAEFRDDDTAEHNKRMSSYCELLAAHSGLDPQRVETIRLASVLHDIGKIGVPDHILLKPGPLTKEEAWIMRQHAENGYRILSGSSSELLQTAADIARTHHERWDGSGYPRGLRQDAIPLEGRMAAIADVFDALTSDRTYRKAYSVSDALEAMQAERGSQFDPELLDLFLANVGSVLSVMSSSRGRQKQLT